MFSSEFCKILKNDNDFVVPTSLVFAAISEFGFSGFSRHTIYKLIIAVTAFLIAFSIKINNKKLNQIISKLLAANISRAVLFCFGIPEFLDSGRKSWMLVSGRWTLDAGLWTLDSGRWALDAGLWALDSGRWTLDVSLITQTTI